MTTACACYSLEPQTLWELIRAGPAIVKGTFENQKRICLMAGEAFAIVTQKPMRIDADGELKTRTPATFKVVRHILPVFAPLLQADSKRASDPKWI